MNRNIIILFFLIIIAAAGYYAYQQGYFDQSIDKVENVLHEICDPSKEDCTAFEETLTDLD